MTNKSVKKFLTWLKKLFSNKDFLNIFIISFLIFVIIIAVSVFLSKFINKKKAKDIFLKMSSYHEGSSGTSALKELLENLNYKTSKIVEALRHEYSENIISHLNTQEFTHTSCMLIIEPEKNIEKLDIKKFKEACDYGFNIIIFSEDPDLLNKIINNHTKNEDDSNNRINNLINTPLKIKKSLNQRTIITYDNLNITNDINKIRVNTDYRFTDLPYDWEKLLDDEYGSFLIKKNFKNGKLVLCSISSFASNLYIRDDENAVLIYKIIEKFTKKNTVYFNEYYHGVQKQFTILYFITKPIYFIILLQILVLFVLLILKFGIKFGQYKQVVKTDENFKIFYFSENLSNLMANKKFSADLIDLMVNNFNKMNYIFPDSSSSRKLDILNAYLKSINQEVKKPHHVKIIFNIIKNHLKQ